ncbi:MAG: hypothetical protein Q8O05_05955 [Chloroflexota bacterium]|nr:hypothetical protein [Chloroflexota bacterium]
MIDKASELKKLVTIASDMQIPADLRTKSIEMIGNIGSQEALRALLDLAANPALPKDERDQALKHSRDIIRGGR